MDFFLVERLLYYGSFLVFPFGVFLVWWWRRRNVSRRQRLLIALLAIGALLFVWARFLEPQLLIVRSTRIAVGFESRIILIADLHLGTYKGRRYVERVIDRLNTLDAEAVLIAGDFISYPAENQIAELLSPFQKLNKPAFAILGNHDVGMPGPPYRAALEAALATNRIELLANRTQTVGDLKILGLGELWRDEAQTKLLTDFSASDRLLVLIHNPDTTALFPHGIADLALAGHTHCGQVRLPYIFRKLIPTAGGFDKGLTNEQSGMLFITCGLGEVGLPLRFLNPPAIDVLELY